jgi:hypothetical protein
MSATRIPEKSDDRFQLHDAFEDTRRFLGVDKHPSTWVKEVRLSFRGHVTEEG